jgi:hypothetical protein
MSLQGWLEDNNPMNQRGKKYRRYLEWRLAGNQAETTGDSGLSQWDNILAKRDLQQFLWTLVLPADNHTMKYQVFVQGLQWVYLVCSAVAQVTISPQLYSACCLEVTISLQFYLSCCLGSQSLPCSPWSIALGHTQAQVLFGLLPKHRSPWFNFPHCLKS